MMDDTPAATQIKDKGISCSRAHKCGPLCACRKDLEAALMALEAATQLLTAFVTGQSREQIEPQYANVRASQLKVRAAMAEYNDHFAEA